MYMTPKEEGVAELAGQSLKSEKGGGNCHYPLPRGGFVAQSHQ